jgi:hypothetical protein
MTGGVLEDACRIYTHLSPRPPGDVWHLSEEEMDTLFTEYALDLHILGPLRERCFVGSETWYDESDDYGDPGSVLLPRHPFSWQGTLNAVTFDYISSCDFKCDFESSTPICQKTFTWEISFEDDFEFRDIRPGWRNAVRNALVRLIRAGEGICGWTPFTFEGHDSGSITVDYLATPEGPADPVAGP